MIAVDTNIVVRYLTGDHPEQAARAREIINGEQIFVSTTVILEVGWVLRNSYAYTPARVIAALTAFCGLPTVVLHDEQIISAALELAGQKADLADALHFCEANHCEAFLTFDRKFVKIARSAGYASVRNA
ncbi:type II toxin-antitoxin system VapC family toxin [Rhizobium sp.]|jgi:predicted nucleic-acid-binding protein|uniref:type II toxin-antitoxin system VapC family toxin n=1 Tax=Rhizobium sp. TaxID=391 RepID=UPI000DB985F1